MFHDKLLSTVQIPKSLHEHWCLSGGPVCALGTPREGTEYTQHVPSSVKTSVLNKCGPDVLICQTPDVGRGREEGGQEIETFSPRCVRCSKVPHKFCWYLTVSLGSSKHPHLRLNNSSPRILDLHKHPSVDNVLQVLRQKKMETT